MKRDGNFYGTQIMIIAICVMMVFTVVTVTASEWPQFQKDEVNTGVCNDKILGRSVSWNVMTHTNTYMAAGVNVVPVVANNNVYVLDCEGYIWSFDAVTGNENGNCSYNSNADFQLSTPAYGDDKIFFAMSRGDEKGSVFAVNANDVSDEIWNVTVDSTQQINVPITYDSYDSGKIYFGTWNGTWSTTEGCGRYYCLNAVNGNEIWNYTTSTEGNGYYWAGACIIGDYIVFGDDLGNITCLNKNTGALVDVKNIKDEVSNAKQIRSSVSCNATYHNATCGRVYFTDGNYTSSSIHSGRLWAYDINTSTGTLTYAWNREIDFSRSTPVVYKNRVYVGCGDFRVAGKLYCIYESDGTVDWSFTVPTLSSACKPGVTASPVLSIDGDATYIYFTVNSVNGRLYCINESGSELWYYEPPESDPSGEYISQGAAIYKNTAGEMRVFFGNDAGKLYALDEGMCGDVDGDGFVTGFDSYLVYTRDLEISQWAADVDCDGFITGFDSYLVYTRNLNCCDD
ncbi:MAG: Pyrrolo-quinoline quinone [Candidatus Syntrophoarchaeum caldarius]|uniref:Pyrrolo-quinoline quinone n=1 Tax=Candidatus Syntropharchaeum caldarium TaxID=1838285 RepID=A0A1F2PBS8_9EURY|nr:MAG: Pyrrolo-quinoline quinone [Candidatus Syntrophoarchaeum caldarius]